jgi:hypothetical protein
MNTVTDQDITFSDGQIDSVLLMMCIGFQSFEVLPLIKIGNNRLLTEKAKIIDHCYQANILSSIFSKISIFLSSPSADP